MLRMDNQVLKVLDKEINLTIEKGNPTHLMMELMNLTIERLNK